MKKTLFLFGILMFFCSVSWANNYEDSEKMSTASVAGYEKQYEKENKKSKETSSSDKQNNCKKDQTTCKEWQIDDDEYFTHNQCFFDKQFREMKKRLCLTRRQENSIDKLYLNFKADMENLYFKYQKERDCFLKNLECNCVCKKENKQNLKEYKKEAKEKYADFKCEIKELLCKKQRKEFKTFQKEEKRKIGKIKKYCIIYKFPCEKCCQK